MIISAALGHFFKSLKIPCLNLLFGRALPTSLGCYMNQESWSPQCLRMASWLEANKHDGNGSCLVTMATSDITDSYLWCSSPTTSIKSHMHLGPKYGNKCLLRLHNIHGNVLRRQSHSSGNKKFFSFSGFAQPIFHLEKLTFCSAISSTKWSMFVGLLKLLSPNRTQVQILGPASSPRDSTPFERSPPRWRWQLLSPEDQVLQQVKEAELGTEPGVPDSDSPIPMTTFQTYSCQ